VPEVPALEPTATTEQWVRALLLQGVALGVRAGEEGLTERLESLNEHTRAANKELGKARFREVVCSRGETPAPQFGKECDAILASLSERFEIRAAPKGYAAFKAAGEAPDQPPPFHGLSLHDDLGAALELPAALAPSRVLADDRGQGRSPLVTLVGAILRQGMTIGMTLHDRAYQPTLDAREAKIAAALGGAPGQSLSAVLWSRFEAKLKTDPELLAQHIAHLNAIHAMLL
jgi:hypothetical protein